MDGRKGTMCGSAQALHFATVHFVAAGAEVKQLDGLPPCATAMPALHPPPSFEPSASNLHSSSGSRCAVIRLMVRLLPACPAGWRRWQPGPGL